VFDCEWSSAALVAVTVGDASADGDEPPAAVGGNDLFPEGEVRFEFFPRRFPLGAGDGSGTTEELEEEFADWIARGAASDGAGVGRGSVAKRGIALVPGVRAAVGKIPERGGGCGVADCFSAADCPAGCCGLV